jgi:hypothetical protein
MPHIEGRDGNVWVAGYSISEVCAEGRC